MSFAGLMEVISADHPLVIVLEDLHWSEARDLAADLADEYGFPHGSPRRNKWGGAMAGRSVAIVARFWLRLGCVWCIVLPHSATS